MRTTLWTGPVGTIRFALFASLAVLLADSGVAQTATYTVLHTFTGNPDGAEPYGALTIAKNGTLYGTTYGGGPNLCYVFAGDYSCGTAFALTRSPGGGWTENIIHAFSGPDGTWPGAALTLGSNGVLYGTTETGTGTATGGTIFELAPPAIKGGAWTESVLYAFPNQRGSTNHTPRAPVLIGSHGTLYTTASSGTVIALLPSGASGGAWTAHALFDGFGFYETVGSAPWAGLVSNAGTLFGTTYNGSDEYCGSDGCGAVYSLAPPSSDGGPWVATALHVFTGPPNGDGSLAAVTMGPGGVLYGTTNFGGSGTACQISGTAGGCGVVFQLTPPSTPGGSWTESVIYSFTGQNGDGALPSGGVLVGKNGALYGTTQYGGSATAGSPCTLFGFSGSGCGTVFRLTPPATSGGAWTETILHSFTGQSGDGAIPLAGLTQASGGLLYGTTSLGGSAGLGTVFSIKP